MTGLVGCGFERDVERFSVILGDMCEMLGFECPDLPRQLLDQFESYRRGGGAPRNRF
jgi:hypothetical protein